MRRREFIAGLGTAAAWPVAGRAQERALPVIGYLSGGSAGSSSSLVPFRQGLKERGYVEGQNVRIEYRYADGQYERLPAMAADLVSHKVDVIQTNGPQLTVIAAKAATSTIPIVHQGGDDLVRLGLAASLSRPGGNVTGIMNMTGTPVIGVKQLEFLHDLMPDVTSFGLLTNPRRPNLTDNEIANVARERRWDIHWEYASTLEELESAFADLKEQRIRATIISADTFFTSYRANIIALAARHALPAIYSFREFVVGGGLMSYGTDLRETNRAAGVYVARILGGERPADLPVQQATKILLTINLKTAEALGLTLPETLLATADEVIE
jgi:putative ABC transport system substrate-binding protein